MTEVRVSFAMPFNPLKGFFLSREDFETVLGIASHAKRELPSIGKKTRFQSNRLVEEKEIGHGFFRDPLGNIERR